MKQGTPSPKVLTPRRTSLTINRVSHEPRHASRRPRRVPLVLVAAIAVTLSAGLGATVQRATGWTRYEWAAHNSIGEPRIYNSADAIAISPQPEYEVPDQPVLRVPPADTTPLVDPPAKGEMKRVSVSTKGVQREALLAVPRDAELLTDSGEPRPLVLVFHGYRETPESIASYSGLGRDGAIVAFPQGIGGAWEGAPYAKTSDGDDVIFTRDLINALSATYKIDATRVYAAGMSNGGGFVGKLSCELPDEFAALAGVASAFYPGTWAACAEPQSDPAHPETVNFPETEGRSVPFLEIHGRRDATIRYRGGERWNTPYLGALRFEQLYAQRSGCRTAPITTRVTNQVLRLQWTNCAFNGDVTHLAVSDAGHTWPGTPKGAEAGQGADHPELESQSDAVTATNEILAFFDKHRVARSENVENS